MRRALPLAQNGHGATSELSPLCAPKRTPADTLNLWGHALVANPPAILLPHGPLILPDGQITL